MKNTRKFQTLHNRLMSLLEENSNLFTRSYIKEIPDGQDIYGKPRTKLVCFLKTDWLTMENLWNRYPETEINEKITINQLTINLVIDELLFLTKKDEHYSPAMF